MVGVSAASLSFQHKAMTAMCCRYEHRAPILTFWTDGLYVAVTAEGEDAAGASVEELRQAVEQYAASLTEWQQKSNRPAVTA